MASDIILGRKPANTGDVGVGELRQNETRLTLLSQPADDYWVTYLGAHIGWDGGGTAPTCRIVIYNTSNSLATSRLAVTAGFQTKALYYPTDPQGGENVEIRLSSPVILRRNLAYLGGVHAANRWMTMGQNNDGSQMSRDYDNTLPPATFTTDVRNAQGRLSMWARARRNEAPFEPSSVSPAPNSQTTDQRPTIEGDFRDPDETLTGFSTIGQADQLSAFHVIVYNKDKTVKIADSGIVSAGTTMRTDRRFRWQVPSNLATGAIYTIRAAVRDRVGAWSIGAEWQFTVLSGGAVSVSEPSGHIATQTPTGQFKYSHRDGTAMQAIQFVYREQGTNTALTPTGTITMSVPHGGTGSIPYPTDFVPLTRGVKAHLFARPQDINGILGAENPASDSVFSVNRLPLAPSNLSPAAGEIITTMVPFRLTSAADPDGTPPSSLVASAWFTTIADPNVAYAIPMFYVGMSGSLAVFEGRPREEDLTDANGAPKYGDYQWTAQMRDPSGEFGLAAAYRAFTFAEPPTITITSPAGSVIDSATPVISFTSSPSAAQQRLRLIDPENGRTVYDSTLVTATGSILLKTGVVEQNKSYDLIVGVRTGLGAYGEETRRVDVFYARPDAMQNQAVRLVMGKFDIATDPSIVRLTWHDPDTSPQDFRGFGIYRKHGDDDWLLVDVLKNADARSWDDDTAPLNDTLSYYVTRFEDEGTDVVESLPPLNPPSVVVQFGGTVISDVSNPGVNRFVARYWLNREETPVRARVTHEGWGRFPTVFYGERNYVRITGTWDVIDEVEFTGTELKDAMVGLADPVLEHVQAATLGGAPRTVPVLRPRMVCYRDGIGRVLFGHLTIDRVEDTHRNPHDVSWTFIETGTPFPVERPTISSPNIDHSTQALQGLLGGSWT